MDIRKKGISVMVSITVAITTSVFLVLLWAPLTDMVGNMNVGWLLFLNTSFWNFVLFLMGLTFIITLVISMAFKEKFKRRD